MKSPLLLGNDLRSMTDETLGVISNAAAIAMNQVCVCVCGYALDGTCRSWGSCVTTGHRDDEQGACAAVLAVPCCGRQLTWLCGP